MAPAAATVRLPQQPDGSDLPCDSGLPCGTGAAQSGAAQTGAAQIIGARERQEDHFAILAPADAMFRDHAGVLALVADGMGGMTHGSAASHAATAAFLHAWQSKTPAERIPQALWRCAHEANREVRAAAQSLGTSEEMGCTLVAAVLHLNSLHWLAVGDSDLLLLRDGELTALTLPHVYGRELDQRAAGGEISWEEALRDPNRDALTSFIGMQPLELVDLTVRSFPLSPGDFLLLTSDGVTNALDERQIAGLCSESAPDAQRIAERLIRMVESRQLPGQDNATAVVMALPLDPLATDLPAALPAATLRPAPMPELVPVHAGISPIEVSRHAARLEAPVPGSRRLSFLARCAALLLGALLILLGSLFGPGLLRPPTPPTLGREELPDPNQSIPSPAQSPASPASRESAPIRGLEDVAAPAPVAPPATPAARQPPASSRPSPAAGKAPTRRDAHTRRGRKRRRRSPDERLSLARRSAGDTGA